MTCTSGIQSSMAPPFETFNSKKDRSRDVVKAKRVAVELFLTPAEKYCLIKGKKICIISS